MHRQKVQRQKRPKTKRLTEKNVQWDKKSHGQNVPRTKCPTDIRSPDIRSQRTKRPKGQNVQGKKRPLGQNIPRDDK